MFRRRHILSGALMPPCLTKWNGLCNFGIECVIKNNSVKKIEFGPMVQEEMPFTKVSYLVLPDPFCLMEQNQKKAS